MKKSEEDKASGITRFPNDFYDSIIVLCADVWP